MDPSSGPASVVYFGVFEVDLRSAELRKPGSTIRLQDKPLQILTLLLEHPGEVVTREEIQTRLWPNGIVVDFEHSINAAVKRLREALGDDAEHPRFIETLPRHGYRFIAPVKGRAGNGAHAVAPVSSPAVTVAAMSPSPGETAVRDRRYKMGWKVLVPAVVTLMLSVAGWLWWQRSHPAAPESRPTPAPLTSYPGFALQPTFSPDSNEVAFCLNETPEVRGPTCCPHFDIYRKLIGSGEPLRLTKDPAWGDGPAWSPDGRFIAFYRDPEEVYVMPALGGAERQVGKAAHGWRLNYPHATMAWTLDGRWVLLPDLPCTPNCGPQGLFALSVETGEKRRLTESIYRDEAPALSPDGRTLAFVRMQEMGIGDVYLLPLGENLQPQGEPERLTYEGLMVHSPVWTRDGKEIFFSTGAMMSERSIRSVPAAAPRSRGEYHPRLETFGEDATTLAISPDDRRLAYSRVSQTINIYKVALSGAAGAVQKPQSIAPSSRTDISPSFSPDGKKIAFASTRSGSMEIWVCDADGSNPRQMTSMGGAVTEFPKWSPDGNTILFGSREEPTPSLYLMSATGGAPRRLTKIPAHWASWSHDGKWIYFMSKAKSGAQSSECRQPGATRCN